MRSILETGKADENAKDNYSKNYRHFQELFDKHSTGNGYFGKKKKEYTASKIVITKAMGTSDVMD